MERNLISLQFIRRRIMDRFYIPGLLVLAITLILLITSLFIEVGASVFSFFICHAIMALYFIYIMASGKLWKGKWGSRLYVLFLLIALTNAYILNNVMRIFDEQPLWFCIIVFIGSVNYLAFPYLKVMPRFARASVFFMLGVSLCCYVYQAIYLLPMTGYAVLAMLLLGASIYAFIPLLFVICSIRMYQRYKGPDRLHTIAFWSGIAVSVLAILVFVSWWCIDVARLDNSYNKATQQNGLPKWVEVVQQIKPDPMLEMVLETEVEHVSSLYRYFNNQGSFFNVYPGWSNGRRAHDPLVLIAASIGGTSAIPYEEKTEILNHLQDVAIDDRDRLWSGDDLFTTNVQTAVRIWPKLHIAYTEKTISVKSEMEEERFNRREAIYKFHLPEGAVVSSLSLWINGKEEKGVLTTKKKAGNAYRTIVGVEARDPSVVHWQEGNTVSVRVFPVMPEEERQFKIGITSPLALEEGRLLYRNIFFDGPPSGNANERVDIAFETPPAGFQRPAVYSEEDGRLVAIGHYRKEWEISMKDEGLSNAAFSNNDISYTVSPYKIQTGNVSISNIYLDVNNAWSRREYNGILAAAKDKAHVWVYADNRLQEVTQVNEDALFDKLSAYRFSLFPFFKITNPQQALVVTKGSMTGLALGTFEGTSFVSSLNDWLKSAPKLMVFHLGGGLSPYLRTLKEHRVFRYEEGSTRYLAALLNQHSFPVDIENDQQLLIRSAGMMINSDTGNVTSNAPDHLQQLFAYNHVMYGLGADQLTGDPEDSVLMEEATAANIVTPLSSLVVLEKTGDYERFDIKKSKDGLKNAGMNNTGAVPEPHEWLLIITGILLLVYLKYRPSFSFKRTI